MRNVPFPWKLHFIFSTAVVISEVHNRQYPLVVLLLMIRYRLKTENRFRVRDETLTRETGSGTVISSLGSCGVVAFLSFSPFSTTLAFFFSVASAPPRFLLAAAILTRHDTPRDLACNGSRKQRHQNNPVRRNGVRAPRSSPDDLTKHFYTVFPLKEFRNFIQNIFWCLKLTSLFRH